MNVSYENFSFELSEPKVIVQGKVGDQEWGHYQFPSAGYTDDGNIFVNWNYGADSIEYTVHDGGIRGPYISKDNGETWYPAPKNTKIGQKWIMPNGKHFLGFVGAGAHPVSEEWWNQYTPVKTWQRWDSDITLYFLDDMERNADTVVRARIYDPVTEEIETYEPKINWPHASVTRYSNGRIYPVTNGFALCNGSIILRDGVLYMFKYGYGFDCTAPTREAAINDYNSYYSVYVFASYDCARTWDFISQISAESIEKPFEGPCEPMADKMPDGSFVMLFRNGGLHPSHMARSTDNCRTWSKPVKFDDFGVLPQILTLSCGVTLASYGRPKLRLRVTSDPTGVNWEEPITIGLSDFEGNTNAVRSNVSCFYTKLLPINNNSALWVYTEFLRPNADGEPARAVIARKITVVKE